jgi:hypothetical protein
LTSDTVSLPELPAFPGSAGRPLLPSDTALQLIDPTGTPDAKPWADLPDDATLEELYRRMVVGRRFDAQATALTRQGRLAVYPSARGQEASQIGAGPGAERGRLAVPDLPRLHGPGQSRRGSGRGPHPSARQLASRL